MKRFSKILGIIVAAGLLFSITACENNDNDPGLSAGATLGNTLRLFGQVQEPIFSMTVSFSKFNGSLDINFPSGGSGDIKGGILELQIGTPPAGDLSPISTFLYKFSQHNNVTASNNSARGFIIETLTTIDGRYFLHRGNFTRNRSDIVMFVYVDGNVTITGTGRREQFTEGNETYINISNNFSLQLTTGWNAILERREWSGSRNTYTNTVSVSVSNPNLRWVIFGSL